MKKLCVVKDCLNTSSNKDISFFSTSEWRNANPLGWKNLLSFFVCSKHFHCKKSYLNLRNHYLSMINANKGFLTIFCFIS